MTSISDEAYTCAVIVGVLYVIFLLVSHRKNRAFEELAERRRRALRDRRVIEFPSQPTLDRPRRLAK